MIVKINHNWCSTLVTSKYLCFFTNLIVIEAANGAPVFGKSFFLNLLANFKFLKALTTGKLTTGMWQMELGQRNGKSYTKPIA